MRIAAGTSLAFVAALALGACSQDNAPSDAIKNAADTVVKQVDGSQAVKLAQGKYAPQDECKNKPGAEDFRTQLAAAVKAKDAAKPLFLLDQFKVILKNMNGEPVMPIDEQFSEADAP